MQDYDLGTAIWDYSWDKLLDSSIEHEQGSAGLVDNNVRLAIPFGEILGSTETMVIGGPPSLPSESDFLYGFSRTGLFVVLKDAYFAGGKKSYPGGSTQTIGASYLLTSRRQFDPSGVISRMRIGLHGLNQWAAIFPATSTYDANNPTSASYSIDLSEKDNQILLDGNELKVSLFHTLNRSPLKLEGFSVTHDCGLLVELPVPRQVDEAIEIAGILARFFTFCNEVLAEIRSLELYFDGKDAPVNCYGSFPRAEEADQTVSFEKLILNYPRFKDDIPVVLENWFRAKDGFEGSRDIVASLGTNSWNMPVELMFIASAQALEALTKYNVDINAMPIDQYRRFRQTLLEALDDEEIKDWAGKRTNSNTKGQRVLLKEFLLANKVVAEWVLGDNVDRFVSVHVAARNQYIHAGTSSKNGTHALSGSDLYWHTRCCLLICRLAIAKHLGFDVGKAIEASKQSNKWTRVIRMTQHLYVADADATSSQSSYS